MEGLSASLNSLEQRLDLVANDLANVNTPGHKRTRAITEAVYPSVQADFTFDSVPVEFASNTPVSSLRDQVSTRLAETRTDFTQGQLRQTNAATDMALDGAGFFVVDVNGEEQYTRAGQFELDADGMLVMHAGANLAPVQGTGGPISIGDPNFTVSRDGTVSDSGGNALGTLRVVDFETPERLEHSGSTLFRDAQSLAGLTEMTPEERNVRQGMLELSNADPMQSLVDMIEIQRAHQAVAKAMQSVDEATGKRISLVMR